MTNSEFSDYSPEPEVRFVSFAQREISRVPLTFEHPRNGNGLYVGLFESGKHLYTPEEVQEMIEEGDIQSPDDIKDWCLPDFSDVPEEEMGICAYETCSEGTPISPVFPNSPEGILELLRHVTENETTFSSLKTSIEGWAGILFGSQDVLAIVDIHSGSLSISDIHPSIDQA